jgi:hypothetical protein
MELAGGIIVAFFSFLKYKREGRKENETGIFSKILA